MTSSTGGPPPPPLTDGDARNGVDVTISMERANVIAAAILPPLAVITLVPFGLLHGWAELGRGFGELFTFWFIPAFLAAVVVHEGLHGLGFLLFGRVPRGEIHFGVDRATVSPFAGCRRAMPAGAYRLAVILPALVLGFAPLVVGYLLGWGAPVVWALVMIVAAGGDLIVLWIVRSVRYDQLVLDHPSRVGCMLLEPVDRGDG